MQQDIYILDADSFERIHLVDTFNSFVWTERYDEYGDVVLILPYQPHNLLWCIPFRYISIPESAYCMRIESVITELSSEGILQVRVTGRDISCIMDYRWYFPNNFREETVFTGMSPLNIAHLMIGRSMNPNSQLLRDPADALPNLVAIAPSNTSEQVPMARIRGGQVSSTVRQYTSMVDAGWRFLLRRNDRTVSYQIYLGSDRTGGSSLSPVLFSQDLGTLKSFESVNSITDYFNSVWVEDSDGRVGRAHNSGMTGWRRHTMATQASDIDASDPFDSMYRRGVEYLNDHKRANLVTGEVTQGIFAYGENYFMGDRVLVQAPHMTKPVKSRIVEATRIIDNDGARLDVSFRPEE